MNILKAIKSVVVKTTSTAVLVCRKHAPEGFMIAGGALVLGGVVAACKGTIKAQETLNHKAEMMDIIEKTEESEEYSAEDRKNDIKLVKTSAAVDIVRAYAPAALLLTAGGLSIFKSHNILSKRNATLAAAYAVVDNSFKKYRAKVIKKLGEEVEKDLYFNIEDADYVKKDEEGKVVERVTLPTPKIAGHSMYARFFDETSPYWTKDAEYNKTWLIKLEEDFNRRLDSVGIVFLNEVYEALGFNPTPAGQIVGWVRKGDSRCEGDGHISFGIFDEINEAKRRFVNGYERSILLDFNVDGPVWDKL